MVSGEVKEIEEMLVKAWPWTPGVLSHLRTMRPIPFDSSHLLIGSDGLHLFAEDASLSLKSQTISDWFWYRGGSLKKYCIIIDQVGKEQFGVGELEMKTADYSSRT